ncbi:hypothetical protein GCM10022381_14590 [Leifsonia kafniensis]|uniref:Low molecular weight protein antigen 6 PH domain-containing protein n=1 Tax=Leifsonia kafniensis TaxID=475957 RepID=A0ABP7KEC7_9MICO
MQTTIPGDRVEIASRFNRLLAVCVWVIAALIAGSLFFVGPGAPLLTLIPAAFFSLLAWEALWRPYTAVTDEGVELRNVFRTIRIPWAALINVDTKYALTLYTPGHKYVAWSAPAPGHVTSLRNSRSTGSESQAGLSASAEVRPGDLINTESGQAAAVVRSRWTRLRDLGLVEAGVADETAVVITRHTLIIVVLSVLALATMVASLSS